MVKLSLWTDKLEIAKKACMEAGEIQKAFYHKTIPIETKSSGIDLVTAVDRQCDERIRSLFTTYCPDDQLLTEETFEEGDVIHLENTWVIDPLDGTTNYAHHFPHFAVSIAYVVHGIPQIATVYDPMKQELFTAVRGEGAFLNGHPITVSQVPDLSQSLLATGFPYDTHIKPQDNIPYFVSFMSRSHGVRRAGAAALDLAYLACGRLDGFWELRLSPWDVAAGVLLVEEAGGLISDFSGQPLDYGARRIHILGANRKQLHAEMLDICKNPTTN